MIGANDSVSLKKVESTYRGAHRFEKGAKTIDMPSQVIEQWVDTVLAQDLEDENKKKKKSDLINAKYQHERRATVKHGIDSISLERNGLSTE